MTNRKLTPRRKRCDSAAAAVKAMQSAALGPLAPPDYVPVRDTDRAYWDAIMLARPRDTWTEADLILAGKLARAYGDIAVLEAQCDREGLIVEGKENPAYTSLDKTTKRAMSLARQILVNTLATVGQVPDIKKASQLERDARQQEEDELIPTMRRVK